MLFVINNDNVLEMLPQILEEIKDSSIISVDAEMSGIIRAPLTLYHTLDDRYEHLKKTVSEYSLIQLGITCMRPDTKQINKYRSSSYVFYLTFNLNNIVQGHSNNINFNLSTINFLTSNNFDLKIWSNSGLCYISETNKECFVQKFDQHMQVLCWEIHMELEKNVAYILAWLRACRLEKMVFGRTKREMLHLLYPVSKNELCNYYFLHNIRQLVLDDLSFRDFLAEDEILWCDLYRGRFCVFTVKIGGQGKRLHGGRLQVVPNVQELHQLMQTERQKLMDRVCAVLTILQAISKSKASLVGHNCLLDLVFIYQTFFEPLPDTLNQFKECIHRVFPRIYDTKLIAQTERILSLRYKSLYDCFMALSIRRKKFQNSLPIVAIRLFQNLRETNFDTYLDLFDIQNLQKMEPHNAGFDSLITGVTFLFCGYLMMKQIKNQNGRIAHCDYRNFLTNGLGRSLNKIHLSRYFNLPLILSNEEAKPLRILAFPPPPERLRRPPTPTSQRPAIALRKEILLVFTNSTAVDHFLKLNETMEKAVDVRRESNRRFVITATSPFKQELFVRCLLDLLEHHKLGNSVSLLDNQRHRKHSARRKLAWLTFFASATCFVVLTARRFEPLFNNLLGL